MSKGMCTDPECINPATREGLCAGHLKQKQRGKPRAPLSPTLGHKLKAFDLVREAAFTMADAEGDEEFKRADDLLRKHSAAYGRRAHREAIKQGIQKAQARGVRVGRPPTVEDQRVAEVVAALGSVRKAARALGVRKDAVWRALGRVEKSKVSPPKP